MGLVLIVDDEVGIAKLLEEVLQDEGHRTTLAANGKQALDRVTVERPDVIITDFMMPVMDGPAMVAVLKADPTTKDVPVIVVSSLPEITVKERCPGVALVLRKPFNIFELADKVADMLRAGGDAEG